MNKYLIASIALLAVVSCAKEGQTPVQNPVEGKQITISATIPVDGLTKVDFEEQGGYTGALKLTWATGDQITVTDASNEANTQVFTLTAGEGTASGTFTGTALAAASSYNIVYDSFGPTFDFTEQTQATDGSMDHLKYTAMLTGVNSYTSFSFDNTWATTNGGTYTSSSVLRLRADIPFDLTDVQAVYIKSDPASVFGGKGIKVNITTPDDEEETDILTVYAALPFGDLAIPAGTGLVVQFQVSNKPYDKYTAYRTLGAMTLKAGKVNSIGLDCTSGSQDITQYANKETDDIGTAGNPYLIGDQHQMALMKDELIGDETVYFKLVDDIDLTGKTWVPLNPDGTFNKGINFDGANHTISHLSIPEATAYPSFVGVLYGTVKDVVFDGASIVAGANTAGIVAGYVGTGSYSGFLSGVTVKNSSLTGASKNRVGGIAGYLNITSGTIEDCHVANVTLASTLDRVGGLFGETSNITHVSGCTATGVTAAGAKNIGGLIGVCYGDVADCWATDSNLTSVNTASNTDIAIGGLVGYFEDSGDNDAKISKCYSTVSITQTTYGRDIGSLVGKMLRGTVEKCYATGNVSGKQRNVGGLIGLITNTSGMSTVKDSYCTGTVNGTGGHSGGLIGLIEKGAVTISNCYAAGSTVTGNFGLGGLIGYQGSADLTAQNCIAWVNTITPTSYAEGNWSSGAVCGVTHPNCILTDNYRKPGMALTAYWVPSASYNHPNVNGTTAPLVRIGTDLVEANAEATDKTAFDSASGEACRWGYHGKIDAGKNLSQLASALGWDASIWDLTGDVPVLK